MQEARKEQSVFAKDAILLHDAWNASQRQGCVWIHGVGRMPNSDGTGFHLGIVRDEPQGCTPRNGEKLEYYNVKQAVKWRVVRRMSRYTPNTFTDQFQSRERGCSA